MKSKIIVLVFVCISSISMNAQEEVNLVLSFRPSLISSNQRIPDPSLSFYDQENKTKYTSLSFNLSTEIHNKKGFFHYPMLAWSYLRFENKEKIYDASLLVSESDQVLNQSEIRLGYGVGKYVYIYKENVFLNFKNHLAVAYTFQKSNAGSNYYDFNSKLLSVDERTFTEPNVYGLHYELNPSIGYRLKNFSLSVGLPLNLGLEIYDGNQKETRNSLNVVTGEQNINEINTKRSATSFNFNYDLELSLRYHFSAKKKYKQ